MVVCAGAAAERNWLGKRPRNCGVEEEESPLAPPICHTLILTKKIVRSPQGCPKGLTPGSKINVKEAGPSLGRPGPEVASVGVSLAVESNDDGSGSSSKNKFWCLICARHGARYFTCSN